MRFYRHVESITYVLSTPLCSSTPSSGTKMRCLQTLSLPAQICYPRPRKQYSIVLNRFNLPSDRSHIRGERGFMPRRTIFLAALLLASPLVMRSSAQKPEGASAVRTLDLLRGWQIQSSWQAKADGGTVSQAGFAAAGWHKTTVPNTVVGTLVDDKTYPDPMIGMNLKNLPGMNYSSATFFALQDMPDGSPFKCSWWWRNEFVMPAAFARKNIEIHFPGINYRANVWFNGTKIGDAADFAGTYRIFEFDLTKLAKPGMKNAIALEIFAPAKGDLGITWVDWNPTPADKDLGIWKEVSLTATGPVAIRNPFVKSQLNLDFTAADLTISADVRNDSSSAVKGVLHAEVDGRAVKQPVVIAAE